MREHDDHQPLDLRIVRIPPWLARREVTIEPGTALDADEEPWREEIVSLEEGAIDVIGRCGLVVHFEAGAVLAFDGVPFAEVRCTGDVPAVLVAIHRQRS